MWHTTVMTINETISLFPMGTFWSYLERQLLRCISLDAMAVCTWWDTTCAVCLIHSMDHPDDRFVVVTTNTAIIDATRWYFQTISCDRQVITLKGFGMKWNGKWYVIQMQDMVWGLLVLIFIPLRNTQKPGNKLLIYFYVFRKCNGSQCCFVVQHSTYVFSMTTDFSVGVR